MDEEKVVTAEEETAPEAAPVEEAAEQPKKRRHRRTKAEIEADAKKAAAKAKREAKKLAGDVAKATKDAVEEGTEMADKITRGRVPTPEIVVQLPALEINTAALADAAVAQFRTEKKRAKITEFRLYVKPEERAAYYVINGEFTGKVDF